ncbi:MAG: hypothetical protein KJO35_10720 [Gammaproteobacteria bacterium]|nr:hypothetical protein [Gammaproteobacteria bacterium]
MSDLRLEELVNAELDGHLSAREAEELKRLLAASTDAGDTRQALHDTDRLLRTLPAQPFPEFLHHRILAAIRLPEQKTRSGLAAWLGQLTRTKPLRYGLAAAAALVVAVTLNETAELRSHDMSTSDMVGSVMPHQGDQEYSVIDRLEIDTTDYSGDFRLERRSGQLAINVVLNANRPIDIAVDLTRAGVQFDSLTETHGRLESVSTSTSQVRLHGTGRKQFTILLRRDEKAETAGTAVIHLDFSRNGEVIGRETLHPSN